MSALEEMIARHEGCRLLPYMDTVGKLTIGIGRNLTDNGISVAEANFMFANDVMTAEMSVRRIFLDWEEFSGNRYNALVDMMFNLGEARFRKFKKMIAAINREEWAMAAVEMRNSLWYSQVPSRAEELARLVEHG